MKISSSVSDSDQIVSLLGRMPLLKMFSPEQLRQVLKFSQVHVYDFGETLIEEGRTDRALFFLIAGSVYVLKDANLLMEFNRVGDIFGEMSIIDGSARSASVVARERVVCLVVDAAFFDDGGGDSEQAMLCQNILFRAIAQMLAERLRRMNEDIIAMRAAAPAGSGSLQA
jgi:CRP-like cAMP-binding protein